jgi:hypothetical protein
MRTQRELLQPDVACRLADALEQFRAWHDDGLLRARTAVRDTQCSRYALVF